MSFTVFPQPKLAGYRLLDSGEGEKLEQFGDWVLRRPDPQAIWRRAIPGERWRNADLCFVRESDRGGRWENRSEASRGRPERAGPPEEWGLALALAGLPVGVEVGIRPTPFKHVGLFPEQASNWLWVEQRRLELAEAGVAEPRLLNLFAYTGAATLLASRAGWKVTHVDASRSSLDWASDNARRSGLPDDAVRWILDDAAAFAARERRREKRYHGILLDPPHYGRGPKGERWQFETGIAPLLESCRALLPESGPSFLVLSTYAIGFSPLTLENLLREPAAGLEIGELALLEEGSGRRLPCGFCARLRIP